MGLQYVFTNTLTQQGQIENQVAKKQSWGYGVAKVFHSTSMSMDKEQLALTCYMLL